MREKLIDDWFVRRHKGILFLQFYFLYFNSEGLPNAKLLLVVKNPIGNIQILNSLINIFKERLVSDFVQFSIRRKCMR